MPSGCHALTCCHVQWRPRVTPLAKGSQSALTIRQATSQLYLHHIAASLHLRHANILTTEPTVYAALHCTAGGLLLKSLKPAHEEVPLDKLTWLTGVNIAHHPRSQVSTPRARYRTHPTTPYAGAGRHAVPNGNFPLTEKLPCTPSAFCLAPVASSQATAALHGRSYSPSQNSQEAAC